VLLDATMGTLERFELTALRAKLATAMAGEKLTLRK
jgi:hypothetical protein